MSVTRTVIQTLFPSSAGDPLDFPRLGTRFLALPPPCGPERSGSPCIESTKVVRAIQNEATGRSRGASRLMARMTRPNLNQLADQLRTLLPESAALAGDEVRQSLKVFLESWLTRMNLVTREEFDAQTALLARTREKLEKLEALVAEMERNG